MSVVAAAVHLNLLPPDPSINDILSLEYFDCLQAVDIGIPVLAGTDHHDNAVYFMGIKRGHQVFARLLDSVAGELGVELDYQLVNCLSSIGFFVHVGGYLSNYPRYKIIGRYLAAWGIMRGFKKIQALVLQVRDG